jgi:hypothetical protein
MKRLTQLASVLSLPPTLAHEATHWAVARLGTDDAQIAVEVTGGRALAAWPPLESRTLRVFAFLGPTLLGLVLAALWVGRGVSLDGWRLLAAIGLAIYTVPSLDDVRGALGRQDAQQQKEDDT